MDLVDDGLPFLWKVLLGDDANADDELSSEKDQITGSP